MKKICPPDQTELPISGGGDDFANRRRFMLNQEAARRTLAAQAIIFAAED
ncbi:hypothetical protein NGC52_23465 [Klebsiella michiganensis]|uniref:Uncharacterized protein n=1 Tax=Klebsiella michiganensis TaxID=1134687 RepID=A0AAX3CJ52_9ENTR|nr:hypothetical protein [Klebsiella michiganensis]QLW89876.1 hypothetical protein HV175_15415 [Klebsiella oxytoca]ELT9724614.1 hypothetical protein [Klebsiella michiganensis]MBX8918844.1 hypothetical protein [Klebsiella michiganensis]MCW9638971.1 hypothetical protein [Klebsiella michiganensis]MCZ0062634.1 hypothetical protein [Klebsiella michiganensis]